MPTQARDDPHGTDHAQILHMIHLPLLLLLTGGVGWFLFTYLAALGEKGALRALFSTLFCWLIALDSFAIIGGAIWPIARQHITGLYGVLFFVLLPYVLSCLRIYWLRKHPKRAIEARLKTRTSALSLGILLIIAGVLTMSWRALAIEEPQIIDGVPATVLGTIAVIGGLAASGYAIIRWKKLPDPVPEQ
jgi:hypothetical protein